MKGSREPLLIVGALPRGGNHLLRGLLDHHPQLLLPPDEDYFVRNLLRSPFWRVQGWLTQPAHAPAFHRKLQKDGHLERVNAGSAKNSSGTEHTIDLDRYYAHVREHHARFSLDGMIRTHFEALAAALEHQQPGPDRIKVFFCALQSDKLDIVLLGRRLSRLYDPRAIFVIRDPRAHFGSKRGRKPDYGLRMFCWRQNLYWRQVERFARDFGPVLRVRFEALVLDTERTMREVCAFAGIPFSDVAVRFTQAGNPTVSNSSYTNVQGIDPAVLGRYREKLGPKELRFIEEHCRPEMFWPETGPRPAAVEELRTGA